MQVRYQRPECPHSVMLKYFNYKEVQSDNKKLPECVKLVTDFHHASCGHVIRKLKCADRRSNQINSPLCGITVQHKRKQCGCVKTMSFHESVKERSLTKPLRCLKAVLQPRPRCSHPLSSRCHATTLLARLWSLQEGEGTSGEEFIVRHGIEYGPSETDL